MQSKRQSALEVCCSTAFGFLLAYGSQLLIFPFYGIHVSHATNFQIVAWFTLISILRSYIFRRIFNRLSPHNAGFTCTLCGSSTHAAAVCPWAIGASLTGATIQSAMTILIFWPFSKLLAISGDWEAIFKWTFILSFIGIYIYFYITSRRLYGQH